MPPPPRHSSPMIIDPVGPCGLCPADARNITPSTAAKIPNTNFFITSSFRFSFSCRTLRSAGGRFMADWLHLIVELIFLFISIVCCSSCYGNYIRVSAQKKRVQRSCCLPIPGFSMGFLPSGRSWWVSLLGFLWRRCGFAAFLPGLPYSLHGSDHAAF